MSNAQEAPRVLKDRRFKTMSGSEKLVFIGKAFVFIITGGFVYPTIWVDE